MKVGNLVNGLAVVDVKRVNKMNIIQFTKAVSEYIDQGYKLDVNSARQIGLVLQVDCYKLEAASSVKVGSAGEQTPTENVGISPKETDPEESVVTESTVQQEQVNSEPVEESKQSLDTSTTPEQNDVTVQKKPRAKKTT